MPEIQMRPMRPLFCRAPNGGLMPKACARTTLGGLGRNPRPASPFAAPKPTRFLFLAAFFRCGAEFLVGFGHGGLEFLAGDGPGFVHEGHSAGALALALVFAGVGTAAAQA